VSARIFESSLCTNVVDVVDVLPGVFAIVLTTAVPAPVSVPALIPSTFVELEVEVEDA
jgi:hypothetical protein